MKKLGLSLALVGLTSVVTTAQAATWSYLTSSTDDTSFYYDADSVRSGTFSNGNKFLLVWEKRIYPEDNNLILEEGTPFEYTIEYSIEQNYYDCTDKKWELGDWYMYDKEGALVTRNMFQYSDTSSSISWDYVVPSTIGGIKLEQLCKIYLTN